MGEFPVPLEVCWVFGFWWGVVGGSGVLSGLVMGECRLRGVFMSAVLVGQTSLACLFEATRLPVLSARARLLVPTQAGALDSKYSVLQVFYWPDVSGLLSC